MAHHSLMKVLPLNPTENASPEALHKFLRECQQEAQTSGETLLVSISITVAAMDPLAVLEAIYEPGHPHFYAEHPSEHTAIAGAEVALKVELSGLDRFQALQTWTDGVFARTIAVGAVEAAFGGPHIFIAAAFAPEVGAGEPFPALTAFVPRWQVARAGESTTAVANIPVSPASDLAEVGERILRAHARFGRISYAGAPAGAHPRGETTITRGEEGDYRDRVAEALRRIERDDFEKVVIARAIDLQADREFHPLMALDGLRQRFPDCFSFSVANGRGDSFIGASPERLVRVSRGRLESDVLAGSIQRGIGAADDAEQGARLQASTKDRHEHELVLASVKRRLAALGLTPEHPLEPKLRKLANVQHLHTPVRAELSAGVRLLDAVAQLHPTPAVGGSPRDKAIAAIPELEGFSRGLYAGALGWLNARGGGEFMVGIRSALVRGNQARVYAGAGIVEGSIPAKEWRETDLKFQALLEGLVPKS
jgi:menaquinone-specific isochorismate synthase